MKTKTNAFTLIELLCVMAILAILAALCVGGLGGCTRSTGARVGYVSKFSYKGNIHKSYEGELVMGGMRTTVTDNGSGLTANVWEFTVADPAVVKQVEALQDNGHRAKLYYDQSLMHNPLSRDTSYLVTKAVDLEVTNAANAEKP